MYDLEYPYYLEIALWTMLGSSFFWALGVPVYLITGYLINLYNGYVVAYAFWNEMTYEKLRYCQTGGYPRCTLGLENEPMWEWFMYPVRRFIM